MYQPPAQRFDATTGAPIRQEQADLQEHFEDFYEDVYDELIYIGGSRVLDIEANIAEQ